MSALRSAGSPPGLAGGEQVALLQAVSSFRGAEQATKAIAATDIGAEAAAPVPRAA